MSYGGLSDAFDAKFRLGSATMERMYAVYLGGSESDTAADVVVDDDMDTSNWARCPNTTG